MRMRHRVHIKFEYHCCASGKKTIREYSQSKQNTDIDDTVAEIVKYIEECKSKDSVQELKTYFTRIFNEDCISDSETLDYEDGNGIPEAGLGYIRINTYNTYCAEPLINRLYRMHADKLLEIIDAISRTQNQTIQSTFCQYMRSKFSSGLFMWDEDIIKVTDKEIKDMASYAGVLQKENSRKAEHAIFVANELQKQVNEGPADGKTEAERNFNRLAFKFKLLATMHSRDHHFDAIEIRNWKMQCLRITVGIVLLPIGIYMFCTSSLFKGTKTERKINAIHKAAVCSHYVMAPRNSK